MVPYYKQGNIKINHYNEILLNRNVFGILRIVLAFLFLFEFSGLFLWSEPVLFPGFGSFVLLLTRTSERHLPQRPACTAPTLSYDLYEDCNIHFVLKLF